MKVAYPALRVLIVGDIKIARARLRVLLRELAIQDVIWAVNGDVALKTLADGKRHFPDLVIADMRMGPMDGVQFCHAVRRTRLLRNPGVPIMVFTTVSGATLDASSEKIDDVDLVGQQIDLTVLQSWIDRYAD